MSTSLASRKMLRFYPIRESSIFYCQYLQDVANACPARFGPRKFKRIVESCLRIRREILESAPVELLQVKAHPPRRNSVIVPRISHNPNQAGNVVNTPAADIGQSRPFVLLVEDNPINLKLLVTSVNRMGYPFMTATNGVEAVEAYTHSSTEVRIVFMDIQMPISRSSTPFHCFELLNKVFSDMSCSFCPSFQRWS